MKCGMLKVLVLLLMTSSIGTALADESLRVSYTASRSVSHTAPIGQGSFDMTVTIELEVTYTCSMDGVLPGASTCHLNVAPHSGTLTVDYDIEPPIGPDLVGSKSIPLPQGGRELLGDPPPIIIPIDSVGDITIVIHGRLLADLTPDVGSAKPSSLEWSTWETHDTVVSADVENVLLTMDTKYSVSFTVTVSVGVFELPSKSVPVEQFPGNPSAEFVIPEFPTLTAWIVVIIVTSSVALFCSRKIKAFS